MIDLCQITHISRCLLRRWIFSTFASMFGCFEFACFIIGNMILVGVRQYQDEWECIAAFFSLDSVRILLQRITNQRYSILPQSLRIFCTLYKSVQCFSFFSDIRLSSFLKPLCLVHRWCITLAAPSSCVISMECIWNFMSTAHGIHRWWTKKLESSKQRERAVKLQWFYCCRYLSGVLHWMIVCYLRFAIWFSSFSRRCAHTFFAVWFFEIAQHTNRFLMFCQFINALGYDDDDDEVGGSEEMPKRRWTLPAANTNALWW